MTGIEKIKILIVGLTTVLSLINFNESDFKNEIVKCKTESNFKY
ncbi:hypothetical protein L1276_000228 [Flavobacterium sp. HSC-32F16]|nr:hypothetical protein [Flavobacterium sp. HSC-32F16]